MPRTPAPRRIATHKKPDADAIVSVWLAERFLFPGEKCQIAFVEYDCDLDQLNADCVVDLGGANCTSRLLFDHKEPAFADRHMTCAAKLIWKYLRYQGQPVEPLQDLVELVHDGDSSRRRGSSELYRQSRRSGLHAFIAKAKESKLSDDELYRRARNWLNRHYSRECARKDVV
jgi:hypothetical protein